MIRRTGCFKVTLAAEDVDEAVRFASEHAASRYIVDRLLLLASEGSQSPQRSRAYEVQPASVDFDSVAVTMLVTNSYELHPDVTYRVHDALLPWPPSDVDSDAYEEWARTSIFDPFTGVGHYDGDSWYDVEIIESSLSALKGKTFDWGY